MALMREREKMEAENNIPSSKTSVDFVRDNVIARRIQKLFIKTIQDLARDELEEFERVFMIIDKDLDLGRQLQDKKAPLDSEERKWESKVAGRPGADIDTDSLLAFLDDSNLLMRSQMYHPLTQRQNFPGHQAARPARQEKKDRQVQRHAQTLHGPPSQYASLTRLPLPRSRTGTHQAQPRHQQRLAAQTVQGPLSPATRPHPPRTPA